MNIERKNQIKEKFWGSCPSTGEVYTNQEIVDFYKGIQTLLKEGVFEKTHAEILRDKDLVNHFQLLAEEYGINETETYIRFKTNLNKLSYTIGTYIKGMSGENLAKRSLKLVSLDRNVEILYNIQLEDEDSQAEYDAIVVAPYGLFVIEVKNWNREMIIDEYGRLSQVNNPDIIYDMPGKFSTKKVLLKETLGDLLPDSYHNIMLFPEEKASCTDNYKKIPLSFGGGVSTIIQEHNQENVLSPDQVSEIVDTLKKSHKVQYASSPVNCETLIDDFASLMVLIEEKISGSEASTDEPKFDESKTTNAESECREGFDENDSPEDVDTSGNHHSHKLDTVETGAAVAFTLAGLLAVGLAVKKFIL